ncbi:hypothetical protein HPB50_012834 [Hyalomma asiaticum]|uniref:Uncharacterized protein n=1 Tax=Hyalomma asiaticum TaxID=266040 RepID=A0ACB7S8R6_HYAAI|nr:hypothetical protein HPB50_012834 [Hyalomma asiaticum]
MGAALARVELEFLRKDFLSDLCTSAEAEFRVKAEIHPFPCALRRYAETFPYTRIEGKYLPYESLSSFGCDEGEGEVYETMTLNVGSGDMEDRSTERKSPFHFLEIAFALLTA